MSANEPKAPRPTSTLAESFASQLNDIFLIDENLDTLERTVEKKKQSVAFDNTELLALEARIKATEKALEEKMRTWNDRGGAESALTANSKNNSKASLNGSITSLKDDLQRMNASRESLTGMMQVGEGRPGSSGPPRRQAPIPPQERRANAERERERDGYVVVGEEGEARPFGERYEARPAPPPPVPSGY